MNQPSVETMESSWKVTTGLSAVVMMAGTLLPVALGSLGPFILKDLDISRPQLGVLVTMTFTGASIASFVMGRIADSIDERRFLLVLMVLASAVLFGTSVAPGYLWLALPFVIGGFPLAGSNPITNKLIASRVPEPHRGMALGIKQAGVPVGILLAGLLLPATAASIGWQGAMRVAALIPLAAAVLSALVLKKSTSSIRFRLSERPPMPRNLIRRLMFFAFLMGGGVAATHTFLPLYSHEVLGFKESTAGLTLSMIGITGIVARIAWTWVSSRTPTIRWALMAVAGSAVASSLAFLAAPSGGDWLVWVGSAIQGASAVAWAPIAMLVVLRNVSYEATGHASAIVNLGFFAGFILSPPIFGALAEATGAYVTGWYLVASQFTLAVLLLLKPIDQTR